MTSKGKDGCGFCTGIKHWETVDGMEFSFAGHYLKALDVDNVGFFYINYCPICGRKLQEHDEWI